MTTLVLSLIGSDRTGLVEALAAVLADHAGNWERSHLTELAGVFAGVAVVTVPDDREEAFTAALEPLRDRGLLDVRAMGGAGEEPVEHGTQVRFELVGNDRPGIVREVSGLLAGLGVSIVELQTRTESAAMAGGTLFRADAVVTLPDELSLDALVGHLEQLADELMVDITPADG